MKFYVYEHWRPDTDLPFYVGKGSGQRAWRFDKHSYNRHYTNIVRKLARLGMCPEVRMVAQALDEAGALALEVERIAHWRAVGVKLTNLTDGGDGASGYQMTAEQKERHREGLKRRVMTPEWRANISAALKGKSKTPEHIKAVADSQRGKKRATGWWSTEDGRAKQLANNPGHSGKFHSDETKEKLRAARAKQPKHLSSETEFKQGSIPWNKGVKCSTKEMSAMRRLVPSSEGER